MQLASRKQVSFFSKVSVCSYSLSWLLSYSVSILLSYYPKVILCRHNLSFPCDLRVCSRGLCWDHLFRWPTLLLRLVEFNELAGVFTRMEHSGSPFPPTPCLWCIPSAHVSTPCYRHHIPYLGIGTRIGDVLYHEEAPWLRIHLPNVAIANYRYTK